MNHNIYTVFESRFPEQADTVLLETPQGETWSYGDAQSESARLARFLSALGVTPGDRVAVQVDKSPQVLFLYLACLRAGFIYLPLNTAYTENELDYFLNDARPAVMVGQPEQERRMAALSGRHGVNHTFTLGRDGGGSLLEASRKTPAEFGDVTRQPDDIAVILYTSGTTGLPKGAMLSHANLAANALALNKAWGWQTDDVMLHALPIFHIHGLFVACHSVLLGGGKLLWLPHFDPDAVIRLLPHSTVFMGVPTFYTRLLSRPDFTAEVCRNMRLFVSGSAPLLKQTFDEFHARSGHTILERYGMTETGMNTSNPLDGPRKAGTVGLALPGVSLRIVDEQSRPVSGNEVGQLQVKGDNVFKGYWQMPDKTAEEFTADGFFRTGDLASQDSDGYVSIVGRNKDLIISGGLNVYPKEVENRIDDLDGILESAVFGVPHPDFGEAVCAAVIPEAGAELNEHTIINTLKGQLANYKVPKRIYFLDTLPRNTMGKVQKNILRQDHAHTFDVK